MEVFFKKRCLLSGLPMVGSVVISCIHFINSNEVDDIAVSPLSLYTLSLYKFIQLLNDRSKIQICVIPKSVFYLLSPTAFF